MDGDAAEPRDLAREVSVTEAFTGVDGGADSLVFLPDDDAPSAGLLVTATREGGLDVFNSDGELRARHAGGRLSGLAAAPGFQLRGSDLPLVFGSVPEADRIFGYAIVSADDIQVLDLPLAEIATDRGVAGLCLSREGVGYVDLVILNTGASAEIWRVRDAGDDLLSVEAIEAFDLPAPARRCVSFDGDLFVASPAAGIARLDADRTVQAQLGIAAAYLAVGEFNGSRLVLTTDGTSGDMSAYYASDFSPFGTITVVQGLSTPGVARPEALAVTDQSYGFTAYSSGMLAVYDGDDSRVKVVSREALSRSLSTIPVD